CLLFHFARGVSLPCSLFFMHDPAPSEIYSLSLHDALPIWISIVWPLGKSSFVSDAFGGRHPAAVDRPGGGCRGVGDRRSVFPCAPLCGATGLSLPFAVGHWG